MMFLIGLLGECSSTYMRPQGLRSLKLLQRSQFSHIIRVTITIKRRLMSQYKQILIYREPYGLSQGWWVGEQQSSQCLIRHISDNMNECDEAQKYTWEDTLYIGEA